ncbi:ribosomal protein S21 [Acrasis kona]|uniref:Ribosomal protein S21 n=1 Tax=Acrasis kona TaxID=1008807 RepID=A0AAW2ZFG0_9EUKA
MLMSQVLLLTAVVFCLTSFAYSDGCGRNGLPKPPLLPTEEAAWGGKNTFKWRSEAVVANAASKYLNLFWMLSSDINDVFLSMPVQMLSGGDRPYCDGQTTASTWFAQWPYNEPPIVGALVHYQIIKENNHMPSVAFVFNQHLNFSGEFTVDYILNGTRVSHNFQAYKTPEGWSKFVWDPAPLELEFAEYPIKDTTLLVKLKGYKDWFPIRFYMPVHTVEMIKDSLPKSQQRYADGRDLFDREDVRYKPNESKESSFRQLIKKHQAGTLYKNSKIKRTEVHSKFSAGRRSRKTSVGTSWNILSESPNEALISSAYNCLEGRDIELEKELGVASGSGWHRVGDRSISLLNDLEPKPILIGVGSSNPFPWPLLGSGDFAFGLSDTVCVRWLMPGEALLLGRGDSWTDGKHTVDQSNFRWYTNPFDFDFCVEQWVHKCSLTEGFMIQSSCDAQEGSTQYCKM